MSNKQSFNLTNNEIATIKVSLKLFIDTHDIEGISPLRKISQNTLANSTLQKLAVKSNSLNVEDLRIMAVSLQFFRSIVLKDISDSLAKNLNKDTGKYFKAITSSIDKIEANLNSLGYSLYST